MEKFKETFARLKSKIDSQNMTLQVFVDLKNLAAQAAKELEEAENEESEDKK